jgi:regulatory protein
VDPALLRGAAMDLLARREHSAEELRQKLQKRFSKRDVPRDTVESVVEQLTVEGLQCDRRYAESLIRQAIIRGYGPRYIESLLKQKRVDDPRQVLAAVVEVGEIDWFERADSVYSKKYHREVSMEDWDDLQRERARRVRFMQHRGFDIDHFHHLIEALSQESS